MEVRNVILSNGNENVMHKDRISMATSSLIALLDYAVSKGIQYTSLRCDIFLERLRILKSDANFYDKFKRNLTILNVSSNYIDDAIFAISGDLQKKRYYVRQYKVFDELNNPYGHSLPKYGAIEMSTIISLVYHIVTNIQSYCITTEKNVEENLLYAMIKSTGDCVEEDGRLVCNWGKTQRILNVLQGYIPKINITASMGVESPEIFMQRINTIITDYLSKLPEENPLRIVISGDKLPSTFNKNDIKISYSRIIDSWKEHATIVYSNEELSKILSYLENLTNSYFHLVDECEIEEIEGDINASFFLDVMKILPNSGRRMSRVNNENEVQEKLGDFGDVINGAKVYIDRFLKQSKYELDLINNSIKLKSIEFEKNVNSGNEKLIDACVRANVRLHESLNFYKDFHSIWNNLDERFNQLRNESKKLYKLQRIEYRDFFGIKCQVDCILNVIMIEKMERNERWLKACDDYTKRSAKVEEISKRSNVIINEVEYDNIIRTAIRAKEEVDSCLLILKPIEGVIDIFKVIKDKLMSLFPQKW